MAQSTTVVWASFPSHEAAEQIRDRLTAHGFAQNSIEIYRQGHGEGCDVAVHTSERNLQRVERLLHTSAPVYALRQLGSGALGTAATNPLVLGAGIALAGLIAYSLLPRNRRPTIRSMRELPRTLRQTSETIMETSSRIPEMARNLSNTVSSAISERPSDGKSGR